MNDVQAIGIIIERLHAALFILRPQSVMICIDIQRGFHYRKVAIRENHTY